MSTTRLHGCGTALATPFTQSGALDEDALRQFVEWQVRDGVQFVVPCGSTGEAATLSVQEHRRVVEITVEQVNGRVQELQLVWEFPRILSSRTIQ